MVLLTPIAKTALTQLFFDCGVGPGGSFHLPPYLARRFARHNCRRQGFTRFERMVSAHWVMRFLANRQKSTV